MKTKNSKSLKKCILFVFLSNNLDEHDENKPICKVSNKFISHLNSELAPGNYSTLNVQRRVTTDIISSPILTLSNSSEQIAAETNKRNSLSEAAAFTSSSLSSASVTASTSRPSSFFRNIFSLNRNSLVVPNKSDTETIESQPADILNLNNISSNIASNYYKSSAVIMNNITAVKNFEAHLGADLAYQLTYDYSSQIQDPVKKETLKATISSVDLIIFDDRNSSGSSADECKHPSVLPPKKSNKTPDELFKLRKNKADEYYHIEEKQANLLKLLANNVYRKFLEENDRQQYALCDQESMQNIFYLLVSLAPFAELVHGEIAMQIKERLENEWDEKPYFGDILTKKYQYYKTYKSILQRFPTCQLSLSNMLKKKAFSSKIKQLLVCV